MRRARRAVTTVTAVVLAVCGGCMPTATVAWSPDGRQVAGLDARATPFIPWFANFLPVAWSADSRSLYFTRRDAPGRPPALFRWSDGTTRSVAALGTAAADVMMVRTSPDGRWVAILCCPPGTIEKSTDGGSAKGAPAAMRLLAVHLPDGGVRPVSEAAGLGVCFTGPDRFAFSRADTDGRGQPIGTGRLIETSLAGPQPTTDPTPLADVLVGGAGAVEAVPDGLLFLAAPRSFPAVPPADPGRDGFTLFHCTRGPGRLTPVADRLWFSRPRPPTVPACSRSDLPGPTRAASRSPSSRSTGPAAAPSASWPGPGCRSCPPGTATTASRSSPTSAPNGPPAAEPAPCTT